MKRPWATLALLAIVAMPVLAQKIETETTDRNRILHLKTALNHLTVIELLEPVIQVATGSQSFKVEWRENRVFVQPTEPDASTNLFIWTASQRLNYELEPAGAVTTMDFAVDQTPVQVIQPKPAAVPPPQPSPTEVLLAGKPIRMESARSGKNRVEVVIHDLYERDGRVLVRYAIRNQGDQAYVVHTPSVYVLTGAHYSRSLYSLANSQLGDQEAHLTNEGRTRVPVLDSRVQSSRVEPGHEAVGVVAVSLPSSAEPTVLRFEFSNDERGPVAAVLVR
jgi:hypothetical protein